MDIKAVASDEAKAALDFLENVPFTGQGTIAGQYKMLSNLVGFKAKLAAALSEAEDEAEEEDKHQ